MVNVLSGGAHAGRALDVQDVLVIPTAARTFAEAIEHAARVRAGAAAELRERGHATSLVADEGGLAAALETNEEALAIATRGIERAGIEASLALDVAATQLVDGDGYRLAREDRRLDGAALAREVAGWAARYPLVSIEDPLGEDDWDAWRLVTDLARRARAAARRRPLRNLDRAPRARHVPGRGQRGARQAEPGRHALGCALGARAGAARGLRDGGLGASGDTEDAWLADLAVGWRAGQIKVGSTQRSERTAKWNRLLRIEAEHPEAESLPGASRSRAASVNVRLGHVVARASDRFFFFFFGLPRVRVLLLVSQPLRSPSRTG